MSGNLNANAAPHSTLDALLIGTPQPFRSDGTLSSMARCPVDGPVWLGRLGFAGDKVADPRYHGGPDKAVHYYPRDHYPAWRAMMGDHPLLDAAGAFGENLSGRGLTEDNVHIGDRFQLGSALVEIAQGRQPCWKLDHHFGRRSMAADVIASGMGGWYFRVIEPGKVAPGDTINRVERGADSWTVARVFTLLIAGGHRDPANREAVHALAHFEPLATGWRERASKLSAKSG